MTEKTCLVCGRSHPVELSVIIELTPEEEATLVKQVSKLPEEFVYCRSCWSLFKDPEMGNHVLRNGFERQILQLGIPAPRARELADHYLNRLAELQRGLQRKIH